MCKNTVLVPGKIRDKVLVVKSGKDLAEIYQSTRHYTNIAQREVVWSLRKQSVKMMHVSTGGGAFLEYVEGTPFAALAEIENQ